MEPSFEKDDIKGTRNVRSITEIKDLIDLCSQVAAQLQIHSPNAEVPYDRFIATFVITSTAEVQYVQADMIEAS